MDYLNIARITKSSILVYKEFLHNSPRSTAQVENQKNLKDIRYNGFMSPKTRSHVRKFLSTWLNAINICKSSKNFKRLRIKPYTTFITLTLPSPQQHTDYLIKRKSLNHFLMILKRRYKVRNYFWRAESQKNGNIHFHIIIDKYIHHTAIRREWNEILIPLGYIDDFELRYGHRNPNSTDIHSLKKINNVGEYIVKYCCKTEGYRPIKGRIWGCSDELRKIRPYCEIVEEGICKVINEIKKDNSCKYIVKEEYELIYCNVEKKLYELSREYYCKYKSYHWGVLRDLYHKKGKIPVAKEILVGIEQVMNQKLEQLEIFTQQTFSSLF